MRRRIAYIDCQAGLSIEQLLAALLDVALPLDTLNQLLNALPLTEYQLRPATVHAQGMGGLSVNIDVDAPVPSHYTLAELTNLYQSSALSITLRQQALSIFQRLAEADAFVRKSDPASHTNTFRYAIRDVIGVTSVLVALEALEITALYASALPLTSGYVQTDAGPIPRLSPVTLQVLSTVRAPWQASSLDSALVTPVAAALLAALASFDAPAFAIEHIGYGFNVQTNPFPTSAGLRLCLGTIQVSAQQGQDMDVDWVTVIETHIDNMSGELLGGLMDRLLAGGALDVSYMPMQMKKNRPATLIRIVCRPEDGEHLAHLLLRETTTLGVRMYTVQRRKAQRFARTIMTPLGPLQVKVKQLGDHVISAAPEYEECQRLAHEHNLPLADVYHIAHEAIRAEKLSGDAR